jgi:hypothetical protein
MVNQSLGNRDKVKDDAIVCSMHVIKWWCYNEGYRYNAYCSPSANYYYGDWMEMNAICECLNIHGRRNRIEMMRKSEVQSKEVSYSLALRQSFVNTNVWTGETRTYERKHPGDFNQSNQRGIL